MLCAGERPHCSAALSLPEPARNAGVAGPTADRQDDAAIMPPDCCAQRHSGPHHGGSKGPGLQPATRNLAISRPIDSNAWISAEPLLAV
jgi:hypothetical protein